MVTTPETPPVTIPETEPIAAVAGTLLAQVPPGELDPKAVDSPTHTLVVPVIAAGNALTVTVALPVMALVHRVVVLVATTVYTPGAVCKPKLMALPDPATALPTGLPPLYNW